VILAFALWLVIFPARQFGQVTLQGSIDSAITNPISFAKNHFTGGIGAMMASDSLTGLPQIAQVVAGSPAEKAGLRAGDIILQINGGHDSRRIAVAGRGKHQRLYRRRRNAHHPARRIDESAICDSSNFVEQPGRASLNSR
jgi:hypothetical protein